MCMRVHVSILMTAFSLVTVGPGCQSSSNTVAAPKAVDGVIWQLVEVAGQPAEPVAAGERAANFRLSAPDGRVTGYGGVNQLTGPYELNGKHLKFAMLALT